MKKYTLHLSILAVLASVSIYLLLKREQGTYRQRDRNFAVADTSAIRLVEFGRYGESLILGREADAWRVNGLYQAHPERIKGLMMLLSRLEVTAPVSKSLAQRIRAELETNGISVLILLEDGSEKSYRVYHDGGGSEKTYMLLEGSDILFSMGVRGYRGSNLEEMYVLNARYWRDKTLIQLSPGEINYIYLEHKQDPGATFHLERNESGSFRLAGEVLPGSWTVPDPDRLSQYLQYFSDVFFEEYTDMQQLSSSGTSIETEPEYVLKVVGRNKNPNHIEIFPVYSIDGNGGKTKDPNRLVAGIPETKEFVVMKYIEIDPILKPYSYFLGE